jgi:RES domain-containing protein
MAAKPLPTTLRQGLSYRIYKPDWSNPGDTSYSKLHGGRWNPPGEFGALYLNATLAVAAAQARRQHAGRAIKLFDLRPDRRPMLATFDLPKTLLVDAVDPIALRALGFTTHFPYDVPWEPCRRIAQRAYRAAGVATRSNAEVTPTSFVGEELALFDSHPLPPMIGTGKPFAAWYPDPIPD